jgi:glycolate oxidase iron-sulfur subunit
LLNEPKNLLRAAGFTVLSPKDEHMCCGSAGTYSILQPEMSQQLRNRKVSTLENLRAEVIAGGNMGCLQHIGAAADLPVLHTVMLLEWAWIGKRPEALAKLATARPMAATGIQRA